MRIGVYGGTFDPIHRGHITVAQAAADGLKLDKLLLIPARDTPLRSIPEGSPSAEDRMEMVRLASSELHVPCEILDIEIRREGKSYTCDTLQQLKEIYPDDELFLIMGTDQFERFSSWKEPKQICSMATLAVGTRYRDFRQEDLMRQKQKLEEELQAKVCIFENAKVVEVSATEIRGLLSRGEGREYLCDAVYGYIARKHLYGTNFELKNLTPDELRPIALSYLKPKRMPHVLGTEQEAIRLAKQYGANVKDAQIASLLHDCTKKLDMDEQKELCRKYHIELDELEDKALKLLHSKTGAEIARDIHGVSDEIYNAIKWHTTGKPDMTLLEKVIYLADYIEPTRDFPGVDELRMAVHTNLDEGLLKGLNDSIEEMKRWGNPVHHNTLDARNYLLMKKGENQ